MLKTYSNWEEIKVPHIAVVLKGQECWVQSEEHQSIPEFWRACSTQRLSQSLEGDGSIFWYQTSIINMKETGCSLLIHQHFGHNFPLRNKISWKQEWGAVSILSTCMCTICLMLGAMTSLYHVMTCNAQKQTRDTLTFRNVTCNYGNFSKDPQDEVWYSRIFIPTVFC